MENRRLFVGLELDDQTRGALAAYRRELSTTVVGKLSHPSLYHLTLCFLGQTPDERIEALRGVMDRVEKPVLTLSLGGLGTFSNGSILWIGLEPRCEPLFALQRALSDALNDAGFLVERGAYSPHITLARQVRSLGELPKPPSATFSVKHITLFESLRVEGQLTYRPIHRSGG